MVPLKKWGGGAPGPMVTTPLAGMSGVQLLAGHTKDFQMEPTAIVLCAQHKQWRKENKPASHNWKNDRGRPDLNQRVTN